MNKTRDVLTALRMRMRSLYDDSCGSMTIPALFFFTTLMVAGGLAIDIQRVYGVHGQMQAYVDDVALAAAQELDGVTGALARSVRVAAGSTAPNLAPLVTGKQNFATDTSLTVLRVTFLSRLGTDPGPLGATPAANDTRLCYYVAPNFGVNQATCEGGETVASASRKAQFVEIRATPRTVSYVVLPIADAIGQFIGAGPVLSQAIVELRATAGRQIELCNAPPIFFCNPNEAGGNVGADFTLQAGRNIRGKVETANLEPGDWGVVDVPNMQNVAEAMGLLNPNVQCFNGLKLKPGVNAGPVRQGLNQRLDVNSDALHPPAPNVIKGSLPQQAACNSYNQSTQTIPYPRDDCFMSGYVGGGTGCQNGNDNQPRVGNGSWRRDAYWATNHPGVPQPPNYNTMSRYDVYKYETTQLPPLPDTLDEKYAPVCAAPYVNPDRDRRVIIAAVVNCLENRNSINTQTALPARIFARLFLTEPVDNVMWNNFSRAGLTWWGASGNLNNENVFVEMIGVVPPDDTILHIYPVLYR